MSIIFTETAVIKASPDEVFRALTDLTNIPKYLPYVTSFETADNRPLHAASHIREKRKIMSKEAIGFVQVTGFNPPFGFALKSQAMGITCEYRYTISPDGLSTQIILQAMASAEGLRRILVPFFASSMKKQDMGQLTRLKSLIEEKSEHEKEVSFSKLFSIAF